MSVQLARRRFTVEEYERMADAGILREDDRVELIDGVYRLVEPARRGRRLASTALPALVLEVGAVPGRRSP